MNSASALTGSNEFEGKTLMDSAKKEGSSSLAQKGRSML